MEPSFSKLLQKQMTRREFLSYIGLMFLTIIGISSFLNNLSGLIPNNKTKLSRSSKKAFGSGAYGI